MYIEMSSNDRPDVPVLNCEKSCRTRSKKKYDSFDDDGSEFFLSTPRMFTQKSTLIFVQIEFCVFFFLLFFFCFLLFCSCVVCGTGNGKCDTHTPRQSASCDSSQPYAQAVRWRWWWLTCVLLKFLCWPGIMRRYLYLHTKKTWHKKLRGERAIKNLPPLSFCLILCEKKMYREILILQCTESAIKWLKNENHIRRICTAVSGRTAITSHFRMKTFIYLHWFHYYLFSFRVATPFSEIHQCVLGCLPRAANAAKMPIKFSSSNRKNVMHYIKQVKVCEEAHWTKWDGKQQTNKRNCVIGTDSIRRMKNQLCTECTCEHLA